MIKIQNIYYMLAYAFQTLGKSSVENVAVEEFDNAADLFAVILSKGISAQIKRGLGREYTTISEVLSAPKGKIDISKSVPLQATRSRQLMCSYDDLSINTYINQVLKATSKLLIHSEYVSLEHKKQLRRSMLFFSDVSDINPLKIEWNRIHISKIDANYKMLLNLCKLILDGMIQTTQSGTVKLTNFIDDQRMSSLYEHFVLAFYRRHFPELNATPAFVDWNVDDGITDFLPAMRTDITLQYRGKTLIIDTKYYGQTMQTNPFYNSQTIHSNNMYQIFSYVKNKDAGSTGTVSGLLLYAKTDEAVVPNNDYSLSGNQISIKALDLDTDFENIAAQLREIVQPLKQATA